MDLCKLCGFDESHLESENLSKQVTEEIEFHSAGLYRRFVLMLDSQFIIKNSLEIKVDEVTILNDDGSGQLVGSGGGVIDYLSGEIEIELEDVPEAGSLSFVISYRCIKNTFIQSYSLSHGLKQGR